MSLSNSFYNAVKEGNVRRVRIMMEDSLLTDPSFRLFDEMEEAASALHGLYEAHDGASFIMDRSKWDDDYMNRLMVEVLDNFSHKRIDHLKSVVRHLRPSDDRNECRETPHSSRNHSESNRKNKGRPEFGAVAGGVAGCLVGTALKLPLLGVVASGFVIAAATGGVIAYMKQKRKSHD